MREKTEDHVVFFKGSEVIVLEPAELSKRGLRNRPQDESTSGHRRVRDWVISENASLQEPDHAESGVLLLHSERVECPDPGGQRAEMHARNSFPPLYPVERVLLSARQVLRDDVQPNADVQREADVGSHARVSSENSVYHCCNSLGTNTSSSAPSWTTSPKHPTL